MAQTSNKTDIWRFLISPDDLSQYLIEKGGNEIVPEVADGHALVRVEKFSFTANNILYAALGKQNKYWDLFAAPDDWGLAPAWGISRVIHSRSPHVVEGERLFGFLPLATHCLICPEKLGDQHIMDGTSRRRPLPDAYNRYTRLNANAASGWDQEDWQLLLRPLALVGMLAAHHFGDQNFFGAENFVVTSASSKTGIGVGKLVKSHSPGISTIGLTSAKNKELVQSLNVFDQVLDYDHIEKLFSEPSVLFDLTGNTALVNRIHNHLASHLMHSSSAGRSHWNKNTADTLVDNPTTERFFTPLLMQHYIPLWGGKKFEQIFGEAVNELQRTFGSQISIRNIRGPEALASLYQALLDGRSEARYGHIVAT